MTDAAGTSMRGISLRGPAPMLRPALAMIALLLMVLTTGGGAAAERAARSAARDAKASAGVWVRAK